MGTFFIFYISSAWSSNGSKVTTSIAARANSLSKLAPRCVPRTIFAPSHAGLNFCCCRLHRKKIMFTFFALMKLWTMAAEKIETI
jgi:hypothetical protein